MASQSVISINAKNITHIDLTVDDDSDRSGNLQRSSPPPPVRPTDTTTTQARFAPNFAIERHPSSTHAPVSPPKINRASASITAIQDKQPSTELPRPSPPVLKVEQKVTQVIAALDDAHSMARLSKVAASNVVSRQVTPTLEQDMDTSAQEPKPTSPKYQTPRKPEWDVASLAKKLVEYRQDIKNGHSRMTSYIIESTHPTERRSLTGANLFAGLTSKSMPAKKGETMKIKSKELEDIDRKSGFKPMSREEKVRITVRSEFASTVLLYLESWLDKLSLPGCDKSTLIRYMASREPDNAITPRQKSDILNSHRPAGSTTPPGANRAADIFTEAFHRVFHQGQPLNKQIELRDVLLLDESVDSIMETKPTAKDVSSSQKQNEHEAIEYWLGTYSILGCLICFSHSCEHGEYDAQNCKRTLSMLPRLSETLKRRRRIPYEDKDMMNGHSRLCKRNCYQSSPRPEACSVQRPWNEEEHKQIANTNSQLLNRECDPDVCGTCGVLDRADPENADDEVLHSTGCQNCPLQRGQAKGLALGQSQLEGVGYGLFTVEPIAQDDFIIEYVGELITHDEGVRREARRGDVFDEESNISYVFTLLENEGIWVDAATYGNLSRYINHASESDKRGCNITPRILYVNGEYRIKFTAMRDIAAGEELFFNYGENFPNLTKKLLDHKTGGKSGEGKKRTRRPNGEGVARKAPKTDKKKPGKGKKAQEALYEEDLTATLGFTPKPLRKRKKGALDDDSEEEEYHPTGTDASLLETPSDGESDYGTGKSSAPRFRKRPRQAVKAGVSDQSGKPRAVVKTRGKRGGARPGSGRPRKYPRNATSATSATSAPKTATTRLSVSVSVSEGTDGTEQKEEQTQKQIVVPDTIVRPIVPLRPQSEEINDSMEDVTLTKEPVDEYKGLRSQLEEDNEDDDNDDDDDDDDDQDVVVRSRIDRVARNRRLPAKLRDDGDWMSASQ
ncbi:hypothetical protein FGSG_00899 [Fusarium graminearum PH-1]|uniref:hypothetical protein n=1 Tax=Gibberella zeae (strain ATCC MYA-4620 / CBS 123657 / FGSC 9075 / NRRL 31084 / PH-1) TaxID=229533 RepID=UPI00021F19E4|nr:hypothetical protein FGSG_00899 [Fusarium graminearum PH-1]ESU06148.1 hypothetical protein FGSG_00899 [Fusarium graminearum PH-1]|eukprot:XP_011316633.1 hypothetical protein FGSG_00899 [Fusarium graminearum PH-1]